MEISYKSKKLEKVCTEYNTAKKMYGEDMAKLINQRIYEIEASDSVETMIKYSIGRCHPLHNNRKGQYAVDLFRSYRLVFTIKKTTTNNPNGSVIKAQIANILEIVDYH